MCDIISIIASGLISWAITFIYFRITNRQEAEATILQPICFIISNDNVTTEGYEEMQRLCSFPSFRYLKNEVKECLNSLVLSYGGLAFFDNNMWICYSLTEMFFEKFDSYELTKLHYKTVYYNDKRIRVREYVNQKAYECLSINEENNQYQEEQINRIYTEFAKEYFNYTDSVNIFEKQSLKQIIETCDSKQELERRNDSYQESVMNFYEITKLHSYRFGK